MASAGTVTIDFAAETARFTTELKKVNDRLKGMESSFKSIQTVAKNAVGFLSVGLFTSFIKSSLNAADALGDVADRIGVSVKELSRLQFAANQSDVEIEALNKSLQKFQVTVSDAFQGVGAAKTALNALNVTAAELRGLGLEQQLGKIADQFQKVIDPADRTRIAIDLFGKQGAQLIPLLLKGSAGIRDLATEADRLGITLDQRTTASIDRANKALDRFSLSASRKTASFFGGFLADLQPLSERDPLIEIPARIEQINELIKEGPGFLGLPKDQFEKSLVAERNLLNFQLFRLQAQKDLNAEKVRTVDVSLQEVQVTAQRRRVPGSPENFEELQQDFTEQARETELQRQETFANLQIELTRTMFEQINNDTKSALTDQLAFEESILQRRDQLRVRDSEAHQEYLATKVAMEKGALNASLGLLQALAGKSKIAAITLIAINKGLAIARAVQNTAVAVSQALATVPYPANLAAAAQMKLLGGIEIATIAATGFVEAGNVSRGGASFGSSVNPVFTQDSDSTQGDTRPTASAQRTVQIVFNGNVYNTDDFKKSVADALEELDGIDKIVFSPTGAQAQAIRAAA